jgi:hypothetical protein
VADTSSTPVKDPPPLESTTLATNVNMDMVAHQDTLNTYANTNNVGVEDNVGASNKSASIDKGKAPKHLEQQPEMQLEQQALATKTPEVTTSLPERPTRAALEQSTPQAPEKTTHSPAKDTVPAPSKATPPLEQPVIIEAKEPRQASPRTFLLPALGQLVVPWHCT